RELRHVAGCCGERPLFQPSAERLFRRRQDRARPGRGLREAQGLERGGMRALAGADSQLRSAPGAEHRRGVVAQDGPSMPKDKIRTRGPVLEYIDRGKTTVVQ